MSFTFHNRDLNVWKAILDACNEAGFILENIILQEQAVSSGTQGINKKNTLTGDFVYNFKKDTSRKPITTCSIKNIVEFIKSTIEQFISEHNGATPSELYEYIIPIIVQNNAYTDETGNAINIENILRESYDYIEVSPNEKSKIGGAVFIGNKLGIESSLLFPIASHTEETYVTIRDAISDLPPVEAGKGLEVTPYSQDITLSDYQKTMVSSTGTVFNHESSNHKPETLKILSMIKQGQTMKDLPEEYHTKSVHSGAYGRMIYDKPAYTLTTRLNTPSVGRITHPTQDRTITPREAARIQSFPDDYRFIGDITSIGMQIGNAVPPLLAKAIASHILEILEENNYNA